MTLILAGGACSSVPAPVPDTSRPDLSVPTHSRDTPALDEGIALEEDDAVPSAAGPSVVVVEGTGRLFNRPRSVSRVRRTQEDGINLEFRNADVRVVLDAVLRDALGLNYSMAPGISGDISLLTNGPVGDQDLLFILEASLKTRNIALVPTADGYQVLPMPEAAQYAALSGTLSPSRTQPGFSVQVVPVRYTQPSQLRRVLEPLAPRGGVVSVDDARGLIIIAGTSQEIASMLSIVRVFDVDWLSGMSFAVFELQYVDPEQLAKELAEIFNDTETPIAGAVRFVPIPRLNRLLVMAKQPAYLEDVEQWVRELDLGGDVPGRRIYVYNVQNGRAIDLAASLTAILGQGAAQTSQGPQLPGELAQGGGVGGVAAPNRSATPGRAPVPGRPDPQAVLGRDALQQQSGIRIVPSEENNSLLIMARPSEFGIVEAALKKMDVPPRQVLIEMSLAEVTLSDELRFGVQWFFESGNGQVTLSEAASGGVSSAFPGFSYAYTGASGDRAVLNALESVTDVEVISSPKLLVLNNQPSTLQIGDEVPVPVQSAVSTNDPNAPIVNSVEYRDTGVILTVTPRINAGGLVFLDVKQEVSDVVETTSSGIDAPTIQQRMIESTVVVNDGETIALGGLIRETQSVTRAGVPYLGRIPVIGNLFRRNATTNRRTELVVLLTPRVIRDVETTREVLEQLERAFDRLDWNTIR